MSLLHAPSLLAVVATIQRRLKKIHLSRILELLRRFQTKFPEKKVIRPRMSRVKGMRSIIDRIRSLLINYRDTVFSTFIRKVSMEFFVPMVISAPMIGLC